MSWYSSRPCKPFKKIRKYKNMLKIIFKSGNQMKIKNSYMKFKLLTILRKICEAANAHQRIIRSRLSKSKMKRQRGGNIAHQVTHTYSIVQGAGHSQSREITYLYLNLSHWCRFKTQHFWFQTVFIQKQIIDIALNICNLPKSIKLTS